VETSGEILEESVEEYQKGQECSRRRRDEWRSYER